MNILQVDLNIDTSEENKTSQFQYLDSTTHHTVIKIDEVGRKIDVDAYDYVYFRNPNYLVTETMVLNIVKYLEKNEVGIAEFTVKPMNQFNDLKLASLNFNDFFSSSIIDVRSQKTVCFNQVFFENKLKKTSKVYSQVSCIWNNSIRKWDNKTFEPNRIVAANVSDIIAILDKTDYLYELRRKNKINMSDNDILRNINQLIIGTEFKENVEKKLKNKLLRKIHNLLQLIKIDNEIENKLFFDLVRKGYFEAALNELNIYISYKYWHNIEKEIEEKYSADYVDIRQTPAWQSTQRFRDLRLELKMKKHRFERKILEVLAKCCVKSEKEIWLLSERVDTASDNSYFLYKYLRENQNKVEAYYIIDKNASEAIEKLKPLGKNRIIYLGSFKHKLMMIKATKLITSFTIEETMMPYHKKEYLEVYSDILNEKDVISIQHGMIIHNISPYLNKHNYHVDYITANNKLEKKIITDTLGFKENEVFITGMARQDNLLMHSKLTNTILFMPTWQRKLQHLSSTQFLQSEYYLKIKALINDKRMNDFLSRNKMKLIVLLHPQFNKYSHMLESKGNLEFVSFDEVDVPQLISECAFLLTDFSSVCVDFLFQRKNVIFYQYNKYASHHVPTAEIKYSDIGKVVTNLTDLFKAFELLSDNHFELLPEYQNAYETLFEVKKDICSHIFQAIESLEKKEH